MNKSHTKAQLDEYFKKRGGYRTKSNREEFWNEDQLHKNVVNYIKEHYPNLKFFSDMSGAHLSKAQANKFSSLRSEDTKVPDLIIWGSPDLYLEIKVKSVSIYTKSGKLTSNQHIRSQANTLKYLRDLGKVADFGVGYIDCITKINQWVEKKSFEYLLK